MSLKFFTSIIISCTIVFSFFNTSAAEFADVSSHWAANAIKVWSDRGIVNGYDGMFKPDAELTRAQLATILSNLLGLTKKAENTYADINPNDWYADAILKCTYAGIIKGDGENVKPNDSITREATMVMLARALKIESSYNINKQFLDLNDISPWAKNYVYTMINKGYVNGVGNSSIAPKSNISRAAVVTILNNAVKMYIGSSGEYKIDSNFDGIIVIKGNGVKIVSENNNLKIVIAEEYSFDSLSVKSSGGAVPIAIGGSGGGGSAVGGGSGQTTSTDTYTVTFFDKPASVFDILKVPKGGAAKVTGSPVQSGYIFGGWDADISVINSDMTVNAKWIDSKQYDNLIALPAYYANSGEIITLPLKISGKVDLCAVDIEITFDTHMLSFVKYENTDQDVIMNYDFVSNTIHLNFLSGKNVSGEIDFCDLKFKCIGASGSKASLKITSKEIVKYGEGDKIVNPQSMVISSDVYIN